MKIPARRSTTLIVQFCTILMCLVSLPRSPAYSSDPEAVETGQKLLTALGGQTAWDNVQYIRFDFLPVRDGTPAKPIRHLWNKWTGNYRVEADDREGNSYIVLFNVNTRTGRAFVNGMETAADGEDHEKYMTMAWRRYINDTYWLIMPYKLFDPGVTLTYEGTATAENGSECDIIQLSFDENIGLTSKDIYQTYINRKTNLMDEWHYTLGGDPNRTGNWAWKNWRKYGDVLLSDMRKNLNQNRELRMDNLSLPRRVPDNVFTDIAIPLP